MINENYRAVCFEGMVNKSHTKNKDTKRKHDDKRQKKGENNVPGDDSVRSVFGENVISYSEIEKYMRSGMLNLPYVILVGNHFTKISQVFFRESDIKEGLVKCLCTDLVTGRKAVCRLSINDLIMILEIMSRSYGNAA